MNTVTNQSLKCGYCGAGPWWGRESISKDAYGRLITECQWICGRCGQIFQAGTISIQEPKKNEESKA